MIRRGLSCIYSAAFPVNRGILNSVYDSLRSLHVAVGISGGVDSAVAAMLLKQQGHDVFGVFMRNWDEAEERGNQNCSVEQDFKDAAAVCKQLNIPLHEVDFVSKYWNHVFTDFISQCARGLTPNPDLACNRYIKFDALVQHAQSLGADKIATGHYARIVQGPSSFELHKGRDDDKDQTYFLASIQQPVLSEVLFPLGDYLKTEVRQLAHDAGLVTADKRSSAGICFIGRRRFSDFLTDYVDSIPGTFIDIDTGKSIQECENITAMTIGQRPGIGGAAERSYVVGKDVLNRRVYVGLGSNHPALFTRSALLRTPHWLSFKHRDQLEAQGTLVCEYKARYRQKSLNCVLHHAGSKPFKPSGYCKLSDVDSEIHPGYLVAEFEEPARAITPQQAFVMYDGERCVGSADICLPGESVMEETIAAVEDFDSSS